METGPPAYDFGAIGGTPVLRFPVRVSRGCGEQTFRQDAGSTFCWRRLYEPPVYPSLFALVLFPSSVVLFIAWVSIVEQNADFFLRRRVRLPVAKLNGCTGRRGRDTKNPSIRERGNGHRE